jgi:hypothetical protein
MELASSVFLLETGDKKEGEVHEAHRKINSCCCGTSYGCGT